VLRIDADFKLPPSEEILSQQENSKDNDEGGDGGGDGRNGRNGTDHSASSHEHSRNDSSKEPPKKRYAYYIHFSFCTIFFLFSH
jgi:hypothetical protein